MEYRSSPSFLFDLWLKEGVVSVEISFLDDIGWSTSLILVDFSFEDCTSPDSLRFKLDRSKGDVAEESSEIREHEF